MKGFLRFCLSLTVLVQFYSFASAQTDSTRSAGGINALLSKTAGALNNYPAEKIHLHFDKPYYSVADTIWFKAYVSSTFNLASAISKVLYVDVINEKDSLIRSLKLPVNMGVAKGQIPIDQGEFTQGNYHIRAYTQWMLNFPDDSFFNKNIFIGEAIDKQLITHVRFKNVSSDKLRRVDARIQFKDADGKPYSNKNVSWQVISGYEATLKGRGTTDANGYLTVIMSEKPTVESKLNDGVLVTAIAVSDKKNLSGSFSLKKTILENDIQFFPEGGSLVAGLTNRIAFKALKSDGLGVGAKGTVTDAAGKQVATFTSEHLGMGSFNLAPQAGTAYKANVIFSDGSSKTYNLPEAKASGIVLSLNNSDPEKIALKIMANEAFLAANPRLGLYLIGQSKGGICYAAQTVLSGAEYSASVAKNKFPKGIAQITLVSAAGVPLSERMIFIDRKDSLDLKISSDAPAYGAKKKVKLTLDAKKAAQPFTGGDFSVAVIDESKVPVDTDAETTIMTSLLLSGDLRGYVERPNYYFNKPTEKKSADLDLLMLTQGYRSFAVKEVLAGKFPQVTYMPEQGIEISGMLRMSNGLPVRKGTMLLSIPDKRYNKDIQTDPVGNFKFSNLVFNDSSKVTISAKYNPNYRDMVITLNGAPFPSPGINPNAPDEALNIDSLIAPYLNNSKKRYSYLHTLEDVVIRGTAEKKPSHADYPALSGLSSIPDHVVSGDRLTACAMFINCLQGMLAGVTYDQQTNAFYVTRDYNSGRRIPMSIFLNGMNIDVNGLNAVIASEVESIEVFLRDDLGTVNRAYNTNGVIVINNKKKPKGTKISREQLLSMLPKSYELNFSPGGYSVEKQFYSPKYETAASVNQNDLRTTIYWNPNVTTDATGKANFEFYNADGKGNYKVIVEGWDQDGNLGRAVYRYTVK
ncbi:carboxypeptidase regulatory-like domain-containing protein [Pedobacter sp. SYP-B3415]|uniref:carboxypeptidase regulatory-like domain-containing protein n=1 Tax=Pedobacter sp. SYP-B3415 TaxID=2496641 RepID=UPI001F0DB269|nr:carboxypeptidase regulatory-like domain-containing protein [Pedobacter sp. SYP-B3415]